LGVKHRVTTQSTEKQKSTEYIRREKTAISNASIRVEKDSLGDVPVPVSKIWAAQTQRSLEHFSIGTELPQS
jgi:hypothetical protein